MLACALSLALGSCGGGGGQLAGKQVNAAPPTATSTQPPPVTQAPRTTATAPPRTTTAQARTSPATTSTQSSTTTTQVTPPPVRTTTTQKHAIASHLIAETASVTLVKTIALAHYLQSGRVTGTFDGQMQVETKAVDAGISVVFTVQVTGGGSVAGHGLVTPNVTDSKGGLAPIKGFADITSGTGRFAHAEGRHLLVTGRAALNGSRGTVRLTGPVDY